MNHLAHLLLAERSDGLLVGGFLVISLKVG